MFFPTLSQQTVHEEVKSQVLPLATFVGNKRLLPTCENVCQGIASDLIEFGMIYFDFSKGSRGEHLRDQVQGEGVEVCGIPTPYLENHSLNFFRTNCQGLRRPSGGPNRCYLCVPMSITIDIRGNPVKNFCDQQLLYFDSISMNSSLYIHYYVYTMIGEKFTEL
jgi:hypothetical protein